MKKHNIFLCFTLLIFSTLNAQDNNLKNLLELKDRFNLEYQQNSAAVKAYCKRTGNPERWTDGGRVFQIEKLDASGKPVVLQTESNLEAAKTTGTSAAWTGGSLGLNLNGQGMIIGEWDDGAVLSTHQEFTTNRVIQVDGATTVSSHGTHVAGTLIGNGTSPDAKGMMHQGTLWAYDWTNDQSEMAAAAINGLRISNHSYGKISGWSYNSTEATWYWYGTTSVNATTANQFGLYNSEAQQWDQVAFNAPNYLIVKSAGNDRGEGPAAGTSHKAWNGISWAVSTATREIDGGTSGYDCLGYSALSKNLLTVGAVNRIAAGYSSPSSVVMSSFSCWGPTDDGRIKPDIVGAGVDIFSAYSLGNNTYTSNSGTSMASPNVAGSLGLVQQHAKNVRGSMLLGATLKGLAIHTANEAGPANGPDYMYGWGLLNVAGCISTLNTAQTTSGILENTLAQGASFEINVYNDGLKPLQATISWYDPAGPVNAASSFNDRTARLVNDLDLRITRVSDGNTELPWTLNPNSPSAAATKADNIKDNVEKVAILSPVAGWYTIRVTHKGTLNGNQQNYSLIYTGRQICANLNQFPTASISAPLKGAGPYTISALQTQAQHNRMTGALAGSTFQSKASIAGTWITVRSDSLKGALVAQGSTPLNWTASNASSYFIHYNSNSVCGTASTAMTSTIENTTPTCSNSIQNPLAAFSAPLKGAGPYTISAQQTQAQYNQMTGAYTGSTFQSTASIAGTYITVRAGTAAGTVVAQGITPLYWTASSATTTTYFIHYNSNAGCGIASTNMTTTVENITPLCANTSQFPIASFSAPVKGAGPYIITTQQTWGGQYNQMTGALAPSTFQSTASIAGTWITVRSGTATGALVAQGSTPLNWEAAAGGTYFIHYNANSACGTSTTAMTTTVENTTLACANSTLYPAGAFSAPTNGAGPLTITDLQFQTQYNQMNGAIAGSYFRSTASIAGTWITVRAGSAGGTVVAQGSTPLNWIATAGGSYFIHYNTNSVCGIYTAYMTTKIENSTPPAIFSFSPASAKPGDAVTITGKEFNTTAANNIVFFGATRATVTAATAGSLTVTVPAGATFNPIKVLNTGSRLECTSKGNFNPVYSPAKTSFGTSDLLPKVDFTLPTTITPYSIAISDLDGDGKSDLAFASNNSNTIHLMRNTSVNGSISSTSFAPKVDFAAGSLPQKIAVGDLDMDGKPDIIAVNTIGNSISVYRNISTSGSITTTSFAAKVDFATGSIPEDVAIGDLDGDGRPDLAVANYSSNSVSVFRNTGTSGSITTASFAAKVDFPTGVKPFSVAIGDLDGDGKPELAVPASNSNILSVFRNSCSPGIINAESFSVGVNLPTGLYPYSVAIGDLDQDGKADLVVSNQNSNSVSVYRNTAASGSISFAAGVDFTVGNYPAFLSIGDFDGNGKPDVAVANVSSNNLSVLRNTSSSGSITAGSFAAKIDYATDIGPQSVAAGDLDGDGKLELATANGNSSVSILRNADAPSISSFTPSSGLPCTTVITISGKGFYGATAVSIGGTAVQSFTVNSDNQISATVGGGTSGSIKITCPLGTTTSSSSFTVIGQVSAVASSSCGGAPLSVSSTGGALSALSFGYGRKVVNTAFNTSPSVYPSLTASAWVYRTGYISAGFGSIISNDDGGYDRALSVAIDDSYHIFAGRDIATGVVSTLNKWEFMSVSWSASAVTLYRNGVQVFTTSGETITPPSINVSSQGTSIGSSPPSNSANHFIGTIDLVTMWSTLRTPAQLQSEMNSTLASGPQAGLLLYYKFDEGSGTTTADLSGNGRTGTLLNTPVWGNSTAPTGYSSYLWSPGGETTPTISVNPLSTTNYSVRVTNATGCSLISAPATVNIAQISGGQTSICVGGQTTWTGNGTAVSWTSSNPAVATVSAAGVVQGIIPGTATITYTSSPNCTATRQVTVTALPAAPAITGTLSFCPGSSTTLTASAGYSSYLWSNGATTQTISVNTAGNFTVSATNASGCVATSASATTSFLAAPATPVISGGTVPFCSFNSTTLTASAGYSSYLWSNGATTQSISVNTSGTFTVTVKNAANNCSATSASVTTTALVVPTKPVITGNLSICPGSSTTLDAGAGYSSYSWSTGATTRTTTVTTAGSVYVLVGHTLNGCLSESNLVLTSLATSPATPVISGSLSICPGSSTTLNAGAGYSSYLWSNGATTQSISVTTAGSYSVTVKNAAGCSATSASVTTSIASPPATPVISGTLSFCSGSSTTLTASAGYSSYLWSNGATTQSISVTTAASYSVTVKNAAGCSATSASVLTSVLPSLPATGALSGPAQVCTSATGIVYTVPAVSGATSYAWTLPTGATGTSTTNSITLAFSSTFAGGSLCVTPGGICSAGTQTCLTLSTITAAPAQPVSITGTAAGVCSTATQTYSIAAVSGADSYSWTAPANSSIVSGQGSSSIVLQFAAGFTTGTLSVTAVNCFGSSAARTLALSNATAVPASITGPVSAVCAGSTQTYSTAAVSGATIYTWAVPTGAVINSGQGTATISVTFPSSFTSGAVTVKSGTVCYTTGTVRSVTAYSIPVTPASITGTLLAVCAGSTQTYTCPASTTGATTYTWTAPTGATINSGQGTTSVSVTFPAGFVSGNVTVTAGNACGTSTARSVAVYAAPSTPASITGTAVGVCGGTTQTYTCPASTTGATTYTWTAPTGATINSGQGTTSVSVTFPAVFASGSMSVTAGNACGTSTARTLAVSAATAQPGTITGTSSNLCGGGSFTYSIAAVSGATTYSWTAPAGCTITANTGTSITMTIPSGFTTGTLSVIANNACGASTARTLSLTGVPPTPASITGPTSVCASATGLVYSTAVVAGVTTYTWTVPTGAVITAGAATSSITVTWGTLAGSVTVKAGNACGTNATAKSLAVARTTGCRGAVDGENEAPSAMSLYPNPASKTATLSFSSAKEGDYQIRVINALGQSVYSSEGKASEGANSIELNLEKLSGGLYIVQLVQDGQRQQLNMIKR